MAAGLTVICWKWKPLPGYRSKFESCHVNVLRRMVARHCRLPHRFVCITDDAAGLEPGIGVIPLWDDWAQVPNPSAPGRGPSCYRRLKIFARDAGKWLGQRIVSIDLDTVIVGDVTPLWDRPEDLVMWGDQSPRTPYNGSMMLLRAGTRPQVWETFDPLRSPHESWVLKRHFGSDQGWIGACLGDGEAKWTAGDGVHSFRNEVRRLGRLPDGARMVMFHGNFDPWQPEVQFQHRWIAEHYR